MCDCKCLRGPQGLTGVGETGAEGPVGPEGPEGPAFSPSKYNIVPAADILVGNIQTVIASAADAGTLVFWGHVTLSSSASETDLVTCTITPKVNAGSITESVAVNIIIRNNTISFVGSAAILATDTFTLEITLNDYGLVTNVVSGAILYYIA